MKSRTLRGQLRDSLAQHYDAVTKTFTPSFVVGSVGDVCERAYVVATAVGEATYVRARADVTKDREASRGQQRRVRSEQRSCLDAWVRAQRETMEGDKISGQKWFTESDKDYPRLILKLQQCHKIKDRITPV